MSFGRAKQSSITTWLVTRKKKTRRKIALGGMYLVAKRSKVKVYRPYKVRIQNSSLRRKVNDTLCMKISEHKDDVYFDVFTSF